MLLLKELVLSFAEVSEHCQLLQLDDCTDIIVVQNWRFHQRTNISGIFTLETCLVLPGFHHKNFPFVVSQSRYGGDYG